MSRTNGKRFPDKEIIYTEDNPFVPDYEIGGVPVMQIKGVNIKNADGKSRAVQFTWYADADGKQRRASRTRPRVKINPYLRPHLTPIPKEKSIELTVEQMHTLVSCIRPGGWGVPIGVYEGIDGSMATWEGNGLVRMSIPSEHGGCAFYTIKVPEKFVVEIVEYTYPEVKPCSTPSR